MADKVIRVNSAATLEYKLNTDYINKQSPFDQ